MTGACAAAPASGGYIGSISRFIDCRAEILDTSAFGALAAPGSTLSTSNTPSTSPFRITGTTISERDRLLQAIWPGYFSTSGTRIVLR